MRSYSFSFKDNKCDYDCEKIKNDLMKSILDNNKYKIKFNRHLLIKNNCRLSNSNDRLSNSNDILSNRDFKEKKM